MRARIGALFLILSIIFTNLGCSKTDTISKKGGYVKEIIKIDNYLSYISTIKKLDDNKIMVAGYDLGDNFKVIISNDKGETWSEKDIKLANYENKQVIMDVKTILDSGEILIEYFILEPMQETIHKFAIITTDGDLKDLDKNFAGEGNIQDSDLGYIMPMSNFSSLNDGDILYISPAKDSIIRLDSNSYEEKKIYYIDGYIENFTVCGEILLIKGEESLYECDLTTGEINEYEENFKMTLNDKTENPNIELINTVSSDKVYFYTSIGLYNYNLESKELLEIENGNGYINNPDITIEGVIDLGDGEIIIATKEAFTNECRLIKYNYDSNFTKTAKKELILYSLKENPEINRAISKFNDENTDILIKYEVGLTKTNGVTEADAIKVLNTELMAGKGPDILMLDGLPAESYVDKGVLADLSIFVSEYEEKFFKGVVEAYTIDDKIYQIPRHISIPIMIGEKEIINKIYDIDSLEAVVKEMDNVQNNLILRVARTPENFISSIYCAFENQWLDNNNKINEDNLIKFIEASKNIYNITKRKIEENDKKRIEQYREELKAQGKNEEELREISLSTGQITGIDINPESVPVISVQGEKIEYGSMIYYDSIEILTNSLINNTKLDFKVLTNTGENIFIPKYNMAINNKSKNKDSAIEFLEYFLLNFKTYVMSINKEMFIDTLQMNTSLIKQSEFNEKNKHFVKNRYSYYDSEGNEQVEIQYWLNKDDINKWVNEIDKLNVVAGTDLTVLKEVSKQFERVVKNEITSEEAVSNLVENLELYLSE